MATDRYQHRPTGAYLAVVEAIADLAANEHLDSANRAYASAVKDPAEAMLAASLDGAKRTTGHACLARLVGRACRDRSWHSIHAGDYDDRPPCAPPGTDHGELWVEGREAVAYTSEPYSLDNDRLTDMLAFANRWGLRFTVRSFPSSHFPGRTVLVVWKRRQTKGDAEAPPSAEKARPTPPES